MTVPQISLDSLSTYGGKPKDYYLLEFFRLYEKYWDEMIKNSQSDRAIDTITGLLLATCPHKPTRERLWESYLDLKNGIEFKPASEGVKEVKEIKAKGALTASILSSGDLFTYLAETLEFTEEAFAGA